MRKSTGIVRKLDELGRVVLPIELRRTLSLAEGDGLEVFVNNGDEIVLRKYQPGCVLCGSTEDLCKHPNGTSVCSGCVDVLSVTKPC